MMCLCLQMLLQGQDFGFDVDSVENLIRRHEETEREARVIQEKSKVSLRTCFNVHKTFKGPFWFQTIGKHMDSLKSVLNET